MASSLLFEIGHVGSCDGFSKEFQSPQGRDLAPVVIFDKEGYALDTLEFDVLQDQIVGVFFQILGGQFEQRGRIDVLNVFESQVVAIDKEQDACVVFAYRKARCVSCSVNVFRFTSDIERMVLGKAKKEGKRNRLVLSIGMIPKMKHTKVCLFPSSHSSFRSHRSVFQRQH